MDDEKRVMQHIVGSGSPFLSIWRIFQNSGTMHFVCLSRECATLGLFFFFMHFYALAGSVQPWDFSPLATRRLFVWINMDTEGEVAARLGTLLEVVRSIGENVAVAVGGDGDRTAELCIFPGCSGCRRCELAIS